jgi:hypothetical protein
MRAKLFIILMLPALAVTLAASALGGGGKSEVSALKAATAKYADVQRAIADGYTVELAQTEEYGGGTCIANGDAGAMGIHMLSPGRLDGNLEATNPEVLLYERQRYGRLKLTGVEYVVAGGSQPTLYGQPFADTNLARYGDPATNVWTLHAWVWRPNPNGMFDPWNTRVTC